MNHVIQGLWPAVLTPVMGNGQIDTARAISHSRHMLRAGCDGVTLFGTTGEGPAFSISERKALLQDMLDAGVQPGQLIVTTSASALPEAIDLGRHACSLGCHQQLFMPPFYFRAPREAGIIESVSQFVRGVDHAQQRVLLYHIPGLSSVHFSHGAVAALAQAHPGKVVGVKDSSGDLEHGLALARAFGALDILLGAEQHVAAAMRVGASGSINGLANISPRLMRRIIERPDQVAPADEQLVRDLLSLLTVHPAMPFVCVYKTMLAEQSGDDAWLNVRAPLSMLDNTEAQSVRAGYRAIGPQLANI